MFLRTDIYVEFNKLIKRTLETGGDSDIVVNRNVDISNCNFSLIFRDVLLGTVLGAILGTAVSYQITTLYPHTYFPCAAGSE